MLRPLLLSLLPLAALMALSTKAAPLGDLTNFRVALAQEENPFEESQKLFSEGKYAEAKRIAMDVFGTHSYNVDGYELMRKIAVAQEDKGEQLRWGKWAYWNRKYTGQAKAAKSGAAGLESLWDGWNQDEIILETWEDSMADAAKKASGKKYYRLAGHLMDRLLVLNPADKKLEKSYAKLADKAGQELSGGAFAAATIRRKSARWLAKENAKHEHWEEPFERKTKHYDLYTNISWQFAETAAAALDEINRFYRSVYNYKKKARAKIYCMRKRSDFDRMALKVLGRPMPSRGVGGYWVDELKTVVAYDRSYDEEGFTKDAIWKTLFHEASHQFMDLLTKSRHIPPCWLNEGTSCYFEGCIIKADGTIVKNNPAAQRLVSWYNLDTNPKTRIPLEELISHPRNTGAKDGSLSYEGEYYPYGWALVYFLLNYEENDRRVYGQAFTDDGRISDDYKVVKKAGKLVYKGAYLKYLQHFSERGCEGDRHYAFEIAKKFFVDDIKDPDVSDWNAFESRWRKFCNSLFQEQEIMGTEFADVLQAKCRGYLLADDFERARIAAEQADNKRGEDAETYRLLALSNLGEGRKADAVFWMIRHWELVWPAGKEEEALEAEAWLKKNGGKDYLKLYIEPTRLALSQIEKSCASALEAGFPVMAQLFAVHCMQVMNMNYSQLETQISVQLGASLEPTGGDQGGSDLRLWQAAYAKGPEGNRQFVSPDLTADLVTYEKDGVLINNPSGRARPGLEYTDVQALRDLNPPFDIRGTVQIDGKWAILHFGLDIRQISKAALLFRPNLKGNDDAVRFDLVKYQTDLEAGTAVMVFDSLGGVRFPHQENIEFEISVNADGSSELTINGTQNMPLPEEFNLETYTGSIAIDVDDGTLALWSNFEIRPNRPFWPVP